MAKSIDEIAIFGKSVHVFIDDRVKLPNNRGSGSCGWRSEPAGGVDVASDW